MRPTDLKGHQRSPILVHSKANILHALLGNAGAIRAHVQPGPDKLHDRQAVVEPAVLQGSRRAAGSRGIKREARVKASKSAHHPLWGAGGMGGLPQLAGSALRHHKWQTD